MGLELLDVGHKSILEVPEHVGERLKALLVQKGGVLLHDSQVQQTELSE